MMNVTEYIYVKYDIMHNAIIIVSEYVCRRLSIWRLSFPRESVRRGVIRREGESSVLLHLFTGYCCFFGQTRTGPLAILPVGAQGKGRGFVAEEIELKKFLSWVGQRLGAIIGQHVRESNYNSTLDSVMMTSTMERKDIQRVCVLEIIRWLGLLGLGLLAKRLRV